ncbi:uncharacterized protein [Spinacia oleracea]|uniref:Reverse transcriptase domain-containing protein n=1 Tax=Spinacia oleracea TaxID=3562 RepID=A0ABM3RS97_SPIOL|nr:uncharacterized protein LOC130472091 [Spinacia oleracea]
MSHSFNEWMQSIHQSANMVSNTRNVDIGMIPVPILQQFDDVANDHVSSIDAYSNADDVVNELNTVITPASHVQIEIDDIQEELDFWNSSIICYVVGANPPIHVMEGFIRRIWKKYNVDKVVLVKKGVFLVRFLTMDMRDNVTSGHFFFDNKPMVVKPWTMDMDMEKEDLKSVPIWIQLRLNFKYWGEKSMFKIVSQLGTPIKRDSATVSRDKLQFARVLVDMPISKSLPDQISFMNEHNELIQVPVTYEWRPTVCTNCKQVGHLTIDCRHAKTKKIWVQKKQQPLIPKPAVIVPEPDVDQEGFQRTLRPIRVRPTSLAPVSVANHFQSLDEDEHSVCSTAVGLLEHKVKLANLGKLYQRIFSNWCFTNNASYHKGGRIIVAWNPGSFSVNIQAVTSQLIHYFVQPVSGNSGFFCTFIYAFNDSHSRVELWKDLKILNTQEPWILCGEFNCVMNMEDMIGSLVRHTEIVDMCECMQHCEMEDIKSVGNFYTWNNKQQGASRVFSKLDRVMENPKWQSIYVSAESIPGTHEGKSPSNTLLCGKLLLNLGVLYKLNGIVKCRELNKIGFNDIQAADLQAYNAMLEAQNVIHQHTDDLSLADAELQVVQDYKIKHQAYVDFLRQKSKAAWIKDGDENTSLFHQSIKARNSQNQVYSIFDMNGDWKDNPADVSQAFLDYYTALLGTTHSNRKSVLSHVVQTGPLVTEAHKAILNAPYTADEVKEALFSIPGRKAPGPDGFGAYFYKDTWSIVGDEVTAVVLDVLQHGKLLKELNHTVITLIPKTKCPKNEMMYQLGFPGDFVDLVMKCVTTPKFSLMPNGTMHGFFKSKRGLRQGDPISPLLFVLCMEYLSRILHKMSEHHLFQFHPRCQGIKLTHLCFADDLIMCSKGDFPSVYLMLQAFKLSSFLILLVFLQTSTNLFSTVVVCLRVIVPEL